MGENTSDTWSYVQLPEFPTLNWLTLVAFNLKFKLGGCVATFHHYNYLFIILIKVYQKESKQHYHILICKLSKIIIMNSLH